MTANKILINRAPVLTLWASVVAERLGFKHDEALSLGKALAGVERYLEGKFGDALPKTRKAMTELANALKPDELAERGFGL